jgi:hypothetical protein
MIVDFTSYISHSSICAIRKIIELYASRQWFASSILSFKGNRLHYLWYLVFTTLITNLNTKWLHPTNLTTLNENINTNCEQK